MLRTLVKNWWMVLLQGALTIAFGIAALAWPGLTLAILLLVLAAFLIVEGGAAVFAAIRGRQGIWYVLGGAAGVIAGLVLLFRPGMSAYALSVVIGLWALIRGFIEIVAAIVLRKEIQGEFWLGLAGLVTAAFGLFVILRPGEGILAILGIIGFFAILKGAILCLLAFKLKGLKGRVAELRERVTG